MTLRNCAREKDCIPLSVTQAFEQSSEVSQAEGFLVAPVKEFLTRTLMYAAGVCIYA